MKHVKVLSAATVARATAFQDVVCDIVTVFNALLGFFGGSSPLTSYLGEKCAIPTPNPTSGNN